MSLTYFDNKSWSQITREERFFCSHLYHFLIGKEKDFISWLNEKLDIDLFVGQEWEISYEVCFYRDFYKAFPGQEKPSKKLRKRTFDMVLFSDSDIIIIEAKVQQPFKKKQIIDLKNDVKNLNKLFGEKNVNVIPLLLCSDIYLKNFLKKHKNIEKTFLSGLPTITWQDLFIKFESKIFCEADAKYKK